MRLRTRYILTVMLLLPLVLSGLLLAALQVPAVRATLLRQLSELTANQPLQIQIEGIQGRVPDAMRLERIRFADTKGPWLEINGLSLDWSPLALITGKIEIANLHVERVVLQRLPELPPPPAPETEETTTSLQWPPQLPDFELQRLSVETIQLAPAVAGKALELSLTGASHSNHRADHSHMRLHLQHKDARSPLLALWIKAKKELNLFDINLQIDDDQALLSNLAALPEPHPLSVSLSGSGSLNAWSGKLAMHASELVSLESDILLDLLEKGRVELDGRVQALGQTLPTAVASLLSNGLIFNTQIDGLKGDTISIRKLQLKTTDLMAEINGTIHPEQDLMKLRLVANALDLENFSTLSGMTLAGSVGIKTIAQGRFDQPELQLSIKGQNMQLADAHIAVLEAQLQALPGDDRTFRLTGSGQIRETTHPKLSDSVDIVTWQLDSVIAGFEQITLRRLDFSAFETKLNAWGEYNLARQQGHVEAQLNAPDIATLPPPLSTDSAAGAAQLNIRLDIAEQWHHIDASIDASGAKLRGLPAPIDALAGETLKLETKLQFEPDKRLEVNALKLDGLNFSINGTLLAGLPDGKLDGWLSLNVMDLAPFSTTIGRPVAGNLQSRLTLAGKVEAPRMSLKTAGNQLSIDERKLGEVVMEAELTDAREQSYEGAAKLYAIAPQGKLEATVDFLVGPIQFALNNIQISGPGLEASGQLVSNRTVIFPSGNLQIKVVDLARLSPWLGRGYAGRLHFAFDAPADNLLQQASVTAKANDLRTPFGQLKQLQAKLNATDVVTKPRLNADVVVEGFSNAVGFGITRLDAKAEGPLDGLRISTNLRGRHQHKPVLLDTHATLAFETEGSKVEIPWLQAVYDEISVNLDKPIKVRTAQEGQIELDPFELSIADGLITAEGKLSSSSNQATIKGKLPLTLLQTFGYHNFNGTTTLAAELTGTPTNPLIEISMQLTAFKPNTAEQKLPTIGLNVEALLENSMAHLQIGATGVAERPSEIQLKLPLSILLNPFLIELPVHGSIQGSANLALSMERLTQALALQDPVINGMLLAHFDIAGTLSEPSVTGSASLDQGRIISMLTGTFLENCKLDLIAQGRQIKLREFSAEDGKAGRLNLVGDMNLSELNRPVFNLRLDSQRAHLLQLPQADATLSGSIDAKGGLDTLSITGNITVDEADIQIPGATDSSIPELEVTEVNLTGVRKAKSKNSKTTSNIGLDIAINAPARLFVRGRGLTSEWGGKLNIKGTATKPSILGDINLRRGRFEFLDRRFKLRKGLIQFSGATPPAPYIDLEAAAELTDMTAIVSVRGLAMRPDLKLSSEPERPQDEILSRVLFNRDIDEITPFQVAGLAAAANQLRGNNKGFNLMASLRKFTTLDTLEVGKDEDSDDVSLTAGKYIHDKTFVQFKPGIGATISKLRVEHELYRRLSADAELEGDGGSSLGLKWKHDY